MLQLSIYLSNSFISQDNTKGLFTTYFINRTKYNNLSEYLTYTVLHRTSKRDNRITNSI